MLFGKKIRELRDENGVLQRQLAALTLRCSARLNAVTGVLNVSRL